MYLNSNDFQTIWKLSHNWTGTELESSSVNNISEDLKITIQRIMNAVASGKISARTTKGPIFWDKSLFTMIIEFSHYMKFRKCLRQDSFDEAYLDSLYVKRPEVLAWCEKDYLSQPPLWKTDGEKVSTLQAYDASDDENHNWYDALTENRKKRVVCLDIAKKLWLMNERQTYEEIYNHPDMKKFGNPNSFSFDAFKTWARPFASDYAKEGGRPIKNK